MILLGGERPVSDLRQMLGTTQGTTSQDLARLREGGIVASRREGTFIFYSLADSKVAKIVKAMFASLDIELQLAAATFQHRIIHVQTLRTPRSKRVGGHAMTQPEKGKQRRGFGSMSQERQKEIASKGGKSVLPEKRAFTVDRTLASAAGKKGGLAKPSGSRAGDVED